ncbi:MAG: lipopolysaccharide heptosyltransferase II [Phycisphaerae bacterium]|nr:lipopolysaccharide heptosyltransferase II [Phycisphaerae bacterium]
MGDAILCTPALRAIREHFKSSKIWFLASSVVRETLSPSAFNDEWIEHKAKNPLAIAAQLKAYRFSHAILFKNSFPSALAVFLARIPARIGYAREKRGFLLTDKLHSPRLPDGKFKPRSMIDYYLAIACWLDADTADRSLGLSIEPKAAEGLRSKMPELAHAGGPIVVIVPGGAFGPSKCWPNVRFGQTADWLITNYNAAVFISVAPEQAERQIAESICDSSEHGLINLTDRSLSLGELKALFSVADLVISNDTGPRHIAVALGRKVVTLFGPNDPAWTDTECENEIQIVGNVPCAPCSKPDCSQSEHLCMQAITVETVCDAAKELLEDDRKHAAIMTQQEFVETSESFFVDPVHESALGKLGLNSVDSVFSFEAATNLDKENLARFRSRVQFEIDAPQPPRATTVFLKRYDRPPVSVQLKNWLSARGKRSCALLEFVAASRLTAFGINTPKTICYGEQWANLFEKRSFIITQEIPDAASLERKLPDCFTGRPARENLKPRRDFTARLADFIKEFHETNYRHRDLYFAHIFYSDDGRFYLIDLARAFEPIILSRRFQVKDIAQIHYSAPGRDFSKTDRLRFYLRYVGRGKLTSADKIFIRKVVSKARRMARHEKKHGRQVPFEN